MKKSPGSPSKAAVWTASAILLVTGAVAWDARTTLLERSCALDVDKKYLELGTVWEQDAFPWTFVIRNSSSHDVAISRFVASCTCVSVNPESLRIPAKGRAQITLLLNLSGAEAVETNQIHRPIHVDVRPIIAKHKQGLESPVWRFRARVRRAFDVAPRTISLSPGNDGSLVEGTRFEPIRVAARALHAFQRVSVICDSTAVAAEIGHSADTDGLFDIRVSCIHPLQRGPIRFTVWVCGTLARGSPGGKTPIYFSGNVEGDVVASPRYLYLGVAPRATEIERQVILLSQRHKPFRIVGVDAHDADRTPTAVIRRRSGEPSSPAAQHVFLVRKRFRKSGLHTSLVRFMIERGTNPVEREEVSVPLTAYVLDDME